MKLPINIVLQILLYYWIGIGLKQIHLLTGVSYPTIGYWTSVVRVVCTQIWNETMPKLGGPGKYVEIDEAVWRRRKYGRGRKKDLLWIFGGVERKEGGGAGTNFVIIVPDRKKETLIPIIQERILAGTTIISDEWKSYDCLKDIGYEHMTVCHKRNFKDPETGACTNTVEGLWSHLRAFFPKHGVRKTFIADCLSMWLVQRNLKPSFVDILQKMIHFIPEENPIIADEEIDFSENEEIPDADDILHGPRDDEKEEDSNSVDEGEDASNYSDE
ncbi:putative Uncharacterized transposase-like protein [Monocercomonoides exilis]|uniref:putative Uncharacterized transposase-like protein n=1 Tax=Monocercomonoides exilis TaxID=2049356 RepID=UPI00355A3170|nr:putative Uncharacterized transposase-like protein [Monocercomonoides exilis]|eukprot:MONOS_13218.1-p1 / transcript=MONOS_13218.1 / gene=MONOS_13218 / organism=Monocercomonoides_exilis_PA203 / gene_product=Uncharacterized transposase-like protein HI1328.1 / transcript_product=Uncharacterized transposase-like protein HI1328.1 / location=Mono_scaffold00792:27998-28813(+) / protein_length=271 / sequence_SO=supercontig / SO=protein_coding / is_pseudo=false